MRDVGEPILSTEEGESNKSKKDVVDMKLKPLDKRTCIEVCDTLEYSDILAWSLYDLTSADVSNKDFFELNDTQAI